MVGINIKVNTGSEPTSIRNQVLARVIIVTRFTNKRLGCSAL